MFLVIFSFIFLGGLLTWYLLKHDHGRKLPPGSLWAAFGFGLLAIVISLFLEGLVIPDMLFKTPEAFSFSTKFFAFMSVGVIEEAAKFIPLALFVYHNSYFREHTDGVIYFAICGLTFGLIENITYSLSLHGTTAIGRLILMPYFHAAATSVIGYYLVSMKINPSMKAKLILACILVPLLHGLYDFGLFSGVPQFAVLSIMITLLFTLALFLYFMEANELDKAMATNDLGPSDNFCTKCGKQNADHGLFCKYCGHHL